MTFEELEGNSPGHWMYDVGDQLKRFIYKRSEQAFAAGDAARDACTTRTAIEARQRTIRETVIRELGGLPPSDTPLNVQKTGELKGDGFRVEKIIFQSRPKNYVTALLYIPDALKAPTGAVLFVSGHSQPAKGYPEYQTVCQYMAQAGLVVFAIDPIGQGERYSYFDPATKETSVGWGTVEHDYAGAQCLPLGLSMARYFIHDAMRAIDYLQTRPEVDPARIGITGNSGGGTQSSLLMLTDPRIAAAAPATFIMNRETYMNAGGAQDAEQIWPGFTAAGFDHEDILLAMAPKPVCVLAVTGDFFPIEGTRRTVERCKRLWEIAGKPGSLELVEDNSTHEYTAVLARAAARFFFKHLRGAECKLDESKIRLFAESQVWCTKSGQVRAEFPDAEFVHESLAREVRALEEKRRAIPAPERKKAAVAWLRERVQRGRKPCELNPRFYGKGEIGHLSTSNAMWWAQEGIFNVGFMFREKVRAGKKLPVTLAIWNGGTTALKTHSNWLEAECAKGRAVLVLNVSGVGPLKPSTYGNRDPEGQWELLHKLSTDLLFLGDDMALLRTYDVLRALDMLQIWPDLDASDVRAYAAGTHSLYAQLAAAIDPRIRAVEASGGISSFAEWTSVKHYQPKGIYNLIVRGILQHVDLPELS
jgi:hypothetical protein